MKLLPLLTFLDEALPGRSKEPFYLRLGPGIAGQMGNKGNPQLQKSSVNLGVTSAALPLPPLVLS